MPSQFSTDWIVNGSLCTPTAYYVMQSRDKEHLQSTMVSSANPSTPTAHNKRSEVASRFLVFTKAVMANNCTNGCPRGRNGVVSPHADPSPSPPPSPPPTLPPAKTEAAHSSEQSSVTTSNAPSERSQLVCPELAVNYSTSLISGRNSQLSTRQRELERTLASVQRQLRERQLLLAHKHAQAQVESHSNRRESSVFTRSCSMEPSPVIPSPPVEVMQVDGAPADPLGSRGTCQRLNSTATSSEDFGNCGDANTYSASLLDESSSLDWSTESEPNLGRRSRGDVSQLATRLQHQLECLEGMVDEEMTEGSSDEEGGELIDPVAGTRWVLCGGNGRDVAHLITDYCVDITHMHGT